MKRRDFPRVRAPEPKQYTDAKLEAMTPEQRVQAAADFIVTAMPRRILQRIDRAYFRAELEKIVRKHIKPKDKP